MQNLSPEDVQRHHALRTEIEDFIDRQQALGGLAGNAVGVRHQIQAHIRAHPDFAWAQQPFAPPPGGVAGAALAVAGPARCAAARPRGVLLVSTLGALFSVSLRTVAVDGWIGVAVARRRRVRVVSCDPRRRGRADVRDLAAARRAVRDARRHAEPPRHQRDDDRRPGQGRAALRPLVLRLALWAVERAVAKASRAARHRSTIPTVATARWIAADGGRRLIFISNYTNAAEGYVRDFIDTEAGAKNINLSFGFGRGYPKTRWILKDGAITDPNAFGYVVTANQQPTAFWYGRYTDISIDNITINRKIREGLFATD